MPNNLNSNLLLQIRPNADIGSTFNNILTNVGRFDQLRENRRQAPLRQQALEQNVQAQAANMADIARQRKLKSLAIAAARIAPMLNSGDIEGAKQLTLQRIADLERQGVDSTESKQFLELLDTNPQLAARRANQGVELGQKLGVFSGSTGLTAGQRERQSLINTINNPNASEIEKQSARIALQVEAPVRTSAQERIATDPNLTASVAQSQAEIEGAKESQKLSSQLKFKPEITKAVKLAESQAKSRGETLSALNRSKAALPGLMNAVGELRELAPIATSTFGGKVFDQAVKQSGFGSTKGATARAKFVAIINNQVLPLLKETFGAAFTFQEGESLKATMGDPDASPEEKLVQLDAFIAQKQRDIETREIETQQQGQAQGASQFQEGQTATNAQGQRIIFTNGNWVPFNG